MAGSQKEFELLFKLKATLGGDFKNTFKQAIDTQKQLRDSLKNVNSIQSKIDGFTKQSAAIDKKKQKLEALRQEQERLQQELRETGEPTEALRRKLERNESQIQQTTAKIEEQEKALDELGEELREAGVNTDNLTGENERLQKSYDNLKSSQERLQRLNEEQQKVKESIGQTKAQLAGTLGVIGGVAAAVYAGPVKAAMDYETALAKVGTIADGTKVPMETMSKEIMALSNSTGIAATALADDVYNAISAGQDTADAVNFVAYSTKLAKAGFAESAQTLDVLTTILNAYGLEADEVGRVSDMLIQTQNKGKVTVAELSSVMGKIIPTAKSNGVALEQITAGYAIMTSKGIPAAESTTYMNSMLNELGKSGTTADKALRAAAGKGFKELMAEGKSLSEVLNILQEDAAKGGKSLADVFGSAEAGKAAVALLSDGAEDFNEQVENMLAASDGIGATQAAFEQMEDTTAARMEKAKNSIANLGVVLGQQLLPVVGTLADKVAGVVAKVSEFAQQNPKAVQTALKAAAAFAGLRVAGLGTKLGFLEIKKGFLGIKTAFESFKALRAAEQLGGVAAKAGGIVTKVGGIVTKVGPIVAIIAAIGAAIYYVANNLEDVRAKIQKTFGDDGLRIFDQIWASITMVGEAFKTAFAGVSTDLFSTLQQILPTLISTLQTAATSILPVIVQLITQIAPLLAQLITGILPVLGQLISAIVQVAGQLITAVLPVITELIAQVINPLLPLFQTIIDAILPVFMQLLNALVPVIQTLASILSSVLGVALEAISGIVQGVMQVFQGLITFITGVFTGNWRQAWDGIKSIFSGIWEAIKSVAKGAVNGIISIINGIIGGLNKLKIPDWVPGLGGKGINIPLIPMLAKGSRNTPDTFIAGEAGPELITNAPGRTVFTAAQTKDIMAAQGAASAAAAAPTVGGAGVQTASTVNTAPTVAAGAGVTNNDRTNHVEIHNSPTIVVNGNQPGDLEAKLEENNQKLLKKVENLLDDKADKEERQRYD